MKRKSSLPPVNKENYMQDVQTYLLKNFGKKQHYLATEVLEASQKSKFYFVDAEEWHSWIMSVFASKNEFDTYHLKIGENLDYDEMKEKMVGKSVILPPDSYYGNVKREEKKLKSVSKFLAKFLFGDDCFFEDED
ncbi:hypothetical protein [Aureivirga marina]|uniref:hypothetical protein n=1 Tax=Aureivirga marina TaxID=1182451 RepID=UPI0018CA58E3|nr:hypothetical protein [Aureivirga marina]